MDIALHPSPHLVNASSSMSSHASSSLPDLDHSDFLAIDDLLDFSHEDIGAPINDSCLSNATSSSPVSDSHDAVVITTTNNTTTKLYNCSSAVASPLIDKKEFLHQPTSASVFSSDELCVPCDELAELEWLSNFVEESFSSGPANLALGNSTANSAFAAEAGQLRGLISNDSFHSTSPVSVLESSTYNNNRRGKVGPPSSANFGPVELSVPGRARTKRSRTAVCFWNTRILSPEASESILESSSTASYYDHDDSGMFNAYYDNDNDDDDDDEDEYAADMDRRRYYYSQYQQQKNKKVNSSKPKKVSNKTASNAGNPGNSSSDGGNTNNTKTKKAKVQDANVPVRKCLHCATQKTPQWRAGPMGPKTLCNACGVRYKSGRLCPEYRPAASPTFVESIHSNSHRKVLEMRRMKGEVGLSVSSPGGSIVHPTSNDHHQQQQQQQQQHQQEEEQQSKMYACSNDGTDSASGGDGSGIDSAGLSAEE